MLIFPTGNGVTGAERGHEQNARSSGDRGPPGSRDRDCGLECRPGRRGHVSGRYERLPVHSALDEVREGMNGTAVPVVRGTHPLHFQRRGPRHPPGRRRPGPRHHHRQPVGPCRGRAGGLWAGASGSPVYFRSGGVDKLAGAIAYGLAGGGSTLAGLTPAEDMEDLLDGGTASTAAASVRVTRAVATRMAEATGLSIAQLGTMTRLRTPLSASGLTDRGLRRMQAAVDRQGLPFIAYMRSSASTTPPPTPARLRAGDSFAAAISVGDITVAGIGTTTPVCNGHAVAFGHPFNWTGDTTMSIHAADTITIVEGPDLRRLQARQHRREPRHADAGPPRRHRGPSGRCAGRLADQVDGYRPRPREDALR
jgi:hypothetical protein